MTKRGLRSVTIPKSEVLRFETRATSFWPREIEDYLIGEHRGGVARVRMILPTRLDDVAEQTNDGVSLWMIAFKRAKETAANLGMQVLGSVHVHPYRRWNAYGVCLSDADMAGFRMFEDDPACAQPPILATCAMYRTGKHPDTFKTFWAFWLKTSSLSLPYRVVRKPVA